MFGIQLLENKQSKVTPLTPGSWENKQLLDTPVIIYCPLFITTLLLAFRVSYVFRAHVYYTYLRQYGESKWEGEKEPPQSVGGRHQGTGVHRHPCPHHRH